MVDTYRDVLIWAFTPRKRSKEEMEILSAFPEANGTSKPNEVDGSISQAVERFFRSMALIYSLVARDFLKTSYPTVTMGDETVKGEAIPEPDIDQVEIFLGNNYSFNLRSMSFSLHMHSFLSWLMSKETPSGDDSWMWGEVETIIPLYNEWVHEEKDKEGD